MKTLAFIFILASVAVIGIELYDRIGPKEPCVLSPREMANLRDSFLIDAMHKGTQRSFTDPEVDSMLNLEAARRADSMYLRRLAQYD